MTTIPKSQNHLADLLGISKSVVSAQVARGMPTSTLEDAQAWRKRNLDPARSKGQRFDRFRTAPPAKRPKTDPVGRVNALMQRADQTLAEGLPLGGLIQELKTAMAAVQQSQRDNVHLSVAVMRVLLERILSWLGDPAKTPNFSDGTPIYCDGASMTDEDAQAAGEMLYSLACGETPWVTPLEGP